MSELQIKGTVKVSQGTINFTAYNELKDQAIQVAKIIRATEVNEESIKGAKKMLAQANKSVKELEDRRIFIKRQMLEPYQEFETQVKEIVGIVKDADNEIRGKVRELEQLERDNKESDIRNIWDLRIRPYKDVTKLLSFEDFLEPKHLNKSESITKIEEQMTTWLQDRQNDIDSIQAISQNPIEVLEEYKNCIDVGQAILTVDRRNRNKEELNKAYGSMKNKREVTTFHIEDPTEAKLAELLLKQNNITYIKEIK